MFVAIVNNYKITAKEYKAELYQLMREEKANEISSKLKKLAINHLIDSCLLIEESQKYRFHIDEQQVQKNFADIENKYSTAEEFTKMLGDLSLSTEKLLENIRNHLRIKQFIQSNFFEKTSVDDKQIRDYYQKHKKSFETPEEIKFCHILVSNKDPYAYQKIDEISKELFGKYDFCKLAKKYSDCPSGTNGGDLGYLPRGKILKELEDVVFSLPIGEISGPIKTKFGYHFIKVMDKRHPRIPEFAEIKNSLRKQLEKLTAELDLLSFIRNLRSRAEIIIHHELL